MQTIVELSEFQKRATNLFTDEEKLSIINYLGRHPMAGDILQGTGAIRKLRRSA